MSPARPPLPLAEALRTMSRHDPDMLAVMEAAAVLDALYDALDLANGWASGYPLQGLGSAADARAASQVYHASGAALARARQAVP